MRRALQGLIVGSLVCLSVPVLPQAALADTGTENAATGAYFWRGKLPSELVVGPVALPNPLNGQDTDADTVARDDLAVGVQTPGQSDKESFLQFDLLELTELDLITKFVVTMPLSKNGPSDDLTKNTVQIGVGAPLQACAPKGGFGSTDAGAWDTKPEVDLANCAPGTFDEAKGTYTFDVTKIAATWLTGDNNGIAIVPADLTTPFQVVFQPTEAHVAQYTFTAGVEEEFDLDLDLGTEVGTTTTTFDDGFTGGGSALSEAPASVFVDAPLAAAEPAPAAPVAAGPAPDVALQVAPAAARSVSFRPPLAFWLAALVVAGVLLAMSLSTGQPVAAHSGGGRQAGQGRVLRQIQQLSVARGTA